jgi:holo-[acyl-carrier protein] synthase
MIGIGVDAVEVARMRDVMARTPGFATRVFTAEEIATLADREDPTPSYAARFAVREAVMKALGVGLGAFDMHDVSVERGSTGEPRLLVRGRAEELARKRGIKTWFVSLTHTESVAMAMVAAE